MIQDLRDTDLYKQAQSIYAAIRRPGSGQISDAAEINARADGAFAVFTATLTETLDKPFITRIARIDLRDGTTDILSDGPGNERSAKYAPDGRTIAFLSDRTASGDYQLYLLDVESGAPRMPPPVAGWIEYIQWSPDGSRLLLGVAGHGADVSGGQGAITSRQRAEEKPSWLPSVETGDEEYRWRHVWIHDLEAGTSQRVGPDNLNIWEAAWSGNSAVVAVASSDPKEGAWYTAGLHRIELADGAVRELYAPPEQIGWPAGAPSGGRVAIVDSVSSDRWIVAGPVRLVDTTTGEQQIIDTNGIDATCLDWRSDTILQIGGHRGFDTVIGLYDAESACFSEIWSSSDISVGGRYITFSPLGMDGDALMIGENYTTAPEISIVRSGAYVPVRSFDVGYGGEAEVIGSVRKVEWRASDGLELQGWLLTPAGDGPHPLIVNIHGGPVWHWRPTALSQPRHVPVLLLLRRGFAVFFPNPRGSAGRGLEFARKVVGDVGGADTHDYLSAIDHLIDVGVADPDSLGVTGISYGGYMTSWLVTQTNRFGAAVSVAPVTNKVSQHLICNIPEFVSLFLGDTYTNFGGMYYQRSPVLHTAGATTPTLNICGALDRCTPPEEAIQFHNALLASGAKSELVIYPEEGHGVRKLPAAIDYAARLVSWFELHLGVSMSDRPSDLELAHDC